MGHKNKAKSILEGFGSKSKRCTITLHGYSCDKVTINSQKWSRGVANTRLDPRRNIEKIIIYRFVAVFFLNACEM